MEKLGLIGPLCHLTPGSTAVRALRSTGLSSNKRPEQVATRVNPAPHPYTAAATQSTRTRGLDHYKVLR